MSEFECPVDGCEECELYRTESWCSRALPDYKGPSYERKVYMEGFWDALEFAEEHYKLLEEFMDKIIECERCWFYDSKEEWCGKHDRYTNPEGYCYWAIHTEVDK